MAPRQGVETARARPRTRHIPRLTRRASEGLDCHACAGRAPPDAGVKIGTIVKSQINYIDQFVHITVKNGAPLPIGGPMASRRNWTFTDTRSFGIHVLDRAKPAQARRNGALGHSQKRHFSPFSATFLPIFPVFLCDPHRRIYGHRDSAAKRTQRPPQSAAPTWGVSTVLSRSYFL